MTRVFVHTSEGPATPETMREAISGLASFADRKLAVLGDMPKLGADELAQHAALSEPLQAANFARVFTVGECMRALRGALPRPMRAAHADSPDQIEASLRAELRDGDHVLVKGWDDGEFGALASRLEGKGADHVI